MYNFKKAREYFDTFGNFVQLRTEQLSRGIPSNYMMEYRINEFYSSIDTLDILNKQINTLTNIRDFIAYCDVDIKPTNCKFQGDRCYLYFPMGREALDLMKKLGDPWDKYTDGKILSFENRQYVVRTELIDFNLRFHVRPYSRQDMFIISNNPDILKRLKEYLYLIYSAKFISESGKVIDPEYWNRNYGGERSTIPIDDKKYTFIIYEGNK